MPSQIKGSTHKNTLEIRLTESVVFLRAGDATGRHRTMSADAPPGMLRGLLTLTLVKPTRISSIEIDLVGKTTTAWPEGVGARRIEITEEHDVYSQSYVFFRASSASASNTRRTLSVGPGLALDHDDEDHSEQSSIAHQDIRLDGPPIETPRINRRHMSVDQTHYHRSFVSHVESTTQEPLTPPYSPEPGPSTSVMQRSSMGTMNESPAQSLEDFRRTFRTGLETEQSSLSSVARGRSHSRPSGSSSSSLRSPHEAPDSRRVSMSFDEDRDFITGSSRRSQSTVTTSPPVDRRAPSTEPDLGSNSEETLRGRKHKRFTFASALLEAMKDRVRSKSPLIDGGRAREGDVTPPRGRTRDRSPGSLRRTMDPGKEREYMPQHQKELSTLERMGEALGFEIDEGREYGDGWKEFRKGVYTYPISFAIPASSPPSLSVDYGSVSWRLKAYAHRPGTFKSKLSATQDITVVATPGEDDTEENESIIVERQWDTQMQYLITVSGRSFPIGGVLPVSLTFMPWTKMKIHRISVLIEERIDYWTQFKRIARTDPISRITLLSLKSPQKDGPPILPLISDDPEAFRHSPFFELLGPDDDINDFASNLMGPGPWNLCKDLRLPKSCELLHTTNRNRRSNISISHMLKIIFRVERGDDYALDPHTGKRKLFDIVVQTPVHILSHLCNPEYIALPPYSRSLDGSSAGSANSGPSRSIGVQSDSDLYDHSSSAQVVATGRLDRMSSLLSAESASSAEHSPTASVFTSPLSRQDSLLDRTELFERLIAGQESEVGEAPPSYNAVVEARPAPTNALH